MSVTIKSEEIAVSLNGFYCANVVTALWADAVRNRLEGHAIFLLGGELEEVASNARSAAARIADRVGDLEGEITGDPRELLQNAPGDGRFELPDCSSVRSISEVGLQALDEIIGAYEEFLAADADGADPVSRLLITELLGQEQHRRADITAALRAR
jgi:ferritin-like protein